VTSIQKFLAVSAAATAAAGAAHAQEIVIDDVFGTIEWTEADSVSVSVDNPAGRVETPEVSRNGDRVSVQGESRLFRSYSCRARRNGDLEVRLSRRGPYHSVDELPVIRVAAPASASLTITDSMIHGAVGDLASADVVMDGCGRLTLGDVSGGEIGAGAVGGEAELQINGSGDLTVGAVAGAGRLSINGSGDLDVAALNSGAEMSVNGSGGILVGALTGPLDIGVHGSGDIEIESGRADPFEVLIAGSGDVRFDGEAIDPSVRIAGSGDVWVRSYSGNVNTRIMGSGEFEGDCAGSCS